MSAATYRPLHQGYPSFEPSDPYGSQEYQEFLGELAKDCQCCPECQVVPCDACQIGAPCDGLFCQCDLEEYDDDYEL